MKNTPTFTEKIPLGRWPWFSEAQIEAAAEVLRSGAVNYWTGEQGRLFEQEMPPISAPNTPSPWPTARLPWNWRCAR